MNLSLWKLPLATLAISLVSIGAGRAQEKSAPPAPRSAQVTLHLEGNAPIVELEFPLASGHIRKGRFLVDTGGGAFIFAEALAEEIGLKPSGPVSESEEGRFAPASPPPTRLGRMPLSLDGVRTIIAVGAKTMSERDNAQGMIPGHMLRRFHVIFDYPAREFTLAEPGSVTPRGTRLPMTIGEHSGFPRIELQIAGQTHGFLLDTGATFTMISQIFLDRWAAAHANWPRATGAVGAANMFGGKMEAEALMLRIRDAKWGEFGLAGLAAVARRKGVFEEWMSPMLAAPIIGALAGNALKPFRVEIDYAGGAVYLEKSGSVDAQEMDLVSLTLRRGADGYLLIDGVSVANGEKVRNAIVAGDKLIEVDGHDLQHAPLTRAAGLLRGKVGDKRTLLIERGGNRVTVRAPVVRHLAE